MPNAADLLKLAAPHKHPRVQHTLTQYRHARQGLHSAVSIQSRRGLDWTNFFIADVQTGFGTFVAFYLANLGWSRSSVGFALGVGGIAGVMALTPGGALIDALPWKRLLLAIGISMLGGAALIFAVAPALPTIFVAETLQGLSSGLIGPAIAAISLGLVGRPTMSLRTGCNFRFSAAGTALTASALGLIGSFVSPRAIFFAAAAMCLPALFAVSLIRPQEIDYARARNASTDERGPKLHRVIDLAKNRGLLMFAGCLVLFQLANASILPILSEDIGASKVARASALISGLILPSQIVVAILAPWVGYHAEARGRKPMLLVALGLVAVRATLYAFVTYYPAIVAIQILDGVTGSIIDVLTVLVIADLTAGTGRFNLTQGIIGTLIGIAASISTAVTGVLFQQVGRTPGFIVIAAVAAATTMTAWWFLPETKPERY